MSEEREGGRERNATRSRSRRRRAEIARSGVDEELVAAHWKRRKRTEWSAKTRICANRSRDERRKEETERTFPLLSSPANRYLVRAEANLPWMLSPAARRNRESALILQPHFEAEDSPFQDAFPNSQPRPVPLPPTLNRFLASHELPHLVSQHVRADGNPFRWRRGGGSRGGAQDLKGVLEEERFSTWKRGGREGVTRGAEVGSGLERRSWLRDERRGGRRREIWTYLSDLD